MARATCSVLMTGLLAAAAPASLPASEAKSAVSPATALKLLEDGNARFATGHAVHPHADRDRMTDVATHGQHPVATVVACSDSRVPVELLFDEGVGDLFVVRVAGNVCDVDEVASIEYAVSHLATPLMVVLGHSHCGAVTAVATDQKLEGSIPRLVDNIRPAVDSVKRTMPHLRGEALIEASVRSNVWQAIQDLLTSSEIARSRCRAGELKIVGAVYDLDTGKIEWLGAHPEQDRLLSMKETPVSGRASRGVQSAGASEQARGAASDSALVAGASGQLPPADKRRGPGWPGTLLAGNSSGAVQILAAAAGILVIRKRRKCSRQTGRAAASTAA